MICVHGLLALKKKIIPIGVTWVAHNALQHTANPVQHDVPSGLYLYILLILLITATNCRQCRNPLRPSDAKMSH